MRVLFLDDMEMRHRIMDAVFGNEHEIVHAWTFDDAVRLLESGSYDQVSLDHDLSVASIMQDPSDTAEPNGTLLCLWIAAEVGMGRLRGVIGSTFVVHSLNPAGRKSMLRILGEAGLRTHEQPFTAVASHWRARAVRPEEPEDVEPEDA